MFQIPVLDSYEWQKAVLEKKLNVPPTEPVKGDRYIIGDNPTGDWSNKEQNIAEYTGKSWKFTKPRDGMLTLVKSESVLYQYINSGWRDFTLLMNKRRISTHSADYEISLDEAGTFFVADSVDEVTFTLPSVDVSDLGTTYTFARIQKDGSLIIQASDQDHIADSGPGCTIYSNKQDIEYASLTITLIQPDRWGIVTGNGTWMTTVADE